MGTVPLLRIYSNGLRYGVATISRLHKIVGLFCRIQSLLWGYFAKETYHLKEPTNRRHPIDLRARQAFLFKLICVSSVFVWLLLSGYD